jgi:hypothetical protein
MYGGIVRQGTTTGTATILLGKLHRSVTLHQDITVKVHLQTMLSIPKGETSRKSRQAGVAATFTRKATA